MDEAGRIGGLFQGEASDLPLDLDADDDLPPIPQTREELGDFIFERWGVRIPDVAVCSERGHIDPLTALWEFFSGEETAVVWWAPRGGSKTYLVGVNVRLDSIFRPGVQAVAVASTEAQAGKAKEHLDGLLRAESGTEPGKHPEVAYSGATKVSWRNGCSLEILPSTMSAVNGPHSARVYCDEVDLMDPAVLEQSRLISQAQGGYPASDLLTSTMKFSFGAMWDVVSEIREAEGAGIDPPYQLRVWCWKEVAERQSNCRIAYPDLPEDEKCQCHRVVKDKLDNGEPRTFAHECGGALARSNGYLSLTDLHRRFRTTSRKRWEAEMSCLRTSDEGLILSGFDPLRHSLENWQPDGGWIVQGVDWGGSEPHAVIWIERTRREWKHTKNGIEYVIPEGSWIAFDSIYIAEVGLDKLAEQVIAREKSWQERVPGFHVSYRFADETGSGKLARQTWAERSENPLATTRVGKDLEGSIRYLQELVEGDMLIVDAARCPMLMKEIESWHWRPGTGKPVDDFDHAVSALRYGAWGARAFVRASSRTSSGQTASAETPYRPQTAAGMTTRQTINYHSAGTDPW
jgi:hypothetical protein